MLANWNANRDLISVMRHFDPWFAFPEESEARAALSMAVDLEERDDAYLLTADLPGVKVGDIQVSVHEGVLSLAVNRNTETERREGVSVLVRERKTGRFERHFRLGSKVDSAAVEADYRDGVLSVRLPKREESKPRQIAVKVAS